MGRNGNEMKEEELSIEDLEYDFKMFLLQYRLKHFDTMEITKGKNAIFEYDVIKFDFHTTRFPRVLHFSTKIKVRYYHDMLHLEARPTCECLNQIKVALLIY